MLSDDTLSPWLGEAFCVLAQIELVREQLLKKLKPAPCISGASVGPAWALIISTVLVYRQRNL